MHSSQKSVEYIIMSSKRHLIQGLCEKCVENAILRRLDPKTANTALPICPSLNVILFCIARSILSPVPRLPLIVPPLFPVPW